MNLEEYEEKLEQIKKTLSIDEAYNIIARKEVMKILNNYEYGCYNLGQLKTNLSFLVDQNIIKHWQFWHLEWDLDITYMDGSKESFSCIFNGEK